jgi:uncharacterized protein YidB (DUF937 family)
MAYDKQWFTDMLRSLGYSKEADDAAQELPDHFSRDQLQQFADRYGLSRDELISRMGGSP